MSELDSLKLRYFDWLLSKVARNKKHKNELKKSGLLEYIHGFEFTWTIWLDENRAYDGKKLREEFLNEKKNSDISDSEIEAFRKESCSFLEMLIALSYRCEKDIMGDVNSPDDHSKDWFWEFLGNLGEKKWVKDGPDFDKKEVKKSIETVINRTFKPSGEGGLFPLKDKDRDQTQIQIWDNLNSYLGQWYPL